MSFKIEKKTIVLALLSALWAFIPILTSYSANLGEVGLDFVLLFGLVCAVGTVCIFAMITLILRSPFAGFGACVVGWFGVAASHSIITGVVNSVPGSTIIYCAVLLALILGVGYVIKKLVMHYQPNEKFVMILLSVVVVVLLSIAVVPITSYSIQSHIATSEMDNYEMEFVVDGTLEHPNIYWIHADSMVSEKTLEKYWGKETVGFTELLEEKGFYVNQDTIAFAGWTTEALCYMMSPDQYDVTGRWTDDTIRDTYRNKNELLAAFSDIGYTTIGIQNSFTSTGSEFENSYLYSANYSASMSKVSEMDKQIAIAKLDQERIFIQYTTYPLYILGLLCDAWNTDKYQFEQISPTYVSYEDVQTILPSSDWLDDSYGGCLTAISHSLNEASSPKLTFIYTDCVHIITLSDGNYYYFFDENGAYLDEYTAEYSAYYEQYLFSEKVLLYLVTQIHEKDPNAVIIIQGDHGPHHKYDSDLLLNFFGSDIVSLKWHLDRYLPVLSAIYIPEEYQTDDYKEILSNPLNIARYLVNNFVGENYEYK